MLFGIFYTIDEAQGKAFIADMEPERRATAVGFYNFANGLIYLLASVIAGILWVWNPAYAFAFAALVALVALLAFLALKSKMQIYK